MRTEQRDINRRENGEIIRGAAWFRRDDMLQTQCMIRTQQGVCLLDCSTEEKQTDRTEYSAAFSRREMGCKTVPSVEGEQGLWSFKKRA